MEENKLEITDKKKVWAVWVNADTNEGRGYEYPRFICSSHETAHRLSKGRNVQGSDGRVVKETAYKLTGNDFWHVPGRIEPETKNDYATRKRREDEEERKRPILEKAMAAGLTEDEIKTLQDK